MKLSKNGRKKQTAICKALMIGFPLAGLLTMSGCGKEPTPIQVPGHYVTGCGCACSNCTYRWFMRDDIDYELPWHPGKCMAMQCTCPCEHSQKSSLDFNDGVRMREEEQRRRADEQRKREEKLRREIEERHRKIEEQRRKMEEEYRIMQRRKMEAEARMKAEEAAKKAAESKQ